MKKHLYPPIIGPLYTNSSYHFVLWRKKCNCSWYSLYSSVGKLTILQSHIFIQSLNHHAMNKKSRNIKNKIVINLNCNQPFILCYNIQSLDKGFLSLNRLSCITFVTCLNCLWPLSVKTKTNQLLVILP